MTAADGSLPGVSFMVGWLDDWAVLSVAGELDIHTAPGLDANLGDVLRLRMLPKVALDLSRLDFCDSSGLAALLRAWRRTEVAGGRLVLLRPTARVTRLLETTGLDRRFEVCDVLPGRRPAPDGGRPWGM
ncbi:STAS domain-containing protein [Actinomadura fibrosa]|uniref:Anti-sigma factor antagonist n=1 Tax=Actinomadura fibrosa TaxID=111802 RepID=A0ABW2XGV8_9ACTN|nr:STAS domain-containing protein [Actinomadura fibrosa]